MNLLSTIIDRLNQRIEVSNIFDQIYGLSELSADGNDKAWVHYIGNGQAVHVTNFDAKQGTLFWSKRGKISVGKIDTFRLAGCKSVYETRFSLSANAVVRKSHLPCDSADAQDWIASRVLRLVSGTDPDFKVGIGVVSYEVVPNGYTNEIKSLPANYEWASVTIDIDVNVLTSSEDGCYDTCATGDIPLPDFEPCVPCLTEVAVDGVTIIGNGTAGDPLVAVGGGGGSGLLVALPFTTDHISANGNQYVVGNVVWYNGNVYRCIANNDSILPTNATYWTNLGAGFPLVQQPIDWNSSSGNNQILNKPTIPVLPPAIVESVTASSPLSSSGGANPDISISQSSSSSDGYLSSTDWSTFDNKQDPLTAGTGIDLTGNVVVNTAPDQIVGLSAGTGIGVSGSYPNFTIDNSAPDQIVGVTAGTGIIVSGTYPNFTIANSQTGAGGGASVNYYLNGSIDQGTIVGNNYKQMSRNAILGGGTDFTLSTGSGFQVIQRFITDIGDPALLIIPAGSWNFELYFSASSNGGTPQFYVDLLKYDGAAFTTIASSIATPEGITNGTVIDLYVTSLAVPNTVLTATDRLAIVVYVNRSGRDITLHTEDNHLCEVLTTFSTGLTALNGLTAQVQTFATGTAGTDFAITSNTATHTFDLPTASASNRGALSSTDWSTFNGKFNTPTGTTAQYVRGDGSLATFPTLPTIYKSTTDTAGYSSNTNTAVFTQLIPANTFAAGDIIRINYRTRKTGTGGSQTLRMYANTTANLVGSPILIGTYLNTGAISFLTNQILRHLAIKNSTNNTEVFVATGAGLASDYGLYNGTTTCAINWTIDQYIVFAIQNSNAVDVNFGTMYLIEKL